MSCLRTQNLVELCIYTGKDVFELVWVPCARGRLSGGFDEPVVLSGDFTVVLALNIAQCSRGHLLSLWLIS